MTRRWAAWLTSPAARHAGRVAAAAVPVVLVNAVAFAGQLAFLRAHLPWPLAGQVMMAVALESVAVYLAFHAHLAQLANDSALRLRLAAYGFALVIAVCNYSHYAGPGWRPTFAAVAVGLCSAISPWLWGIHSRRVSRDALMAAGLIEPHALRLGPTRWLWHPLRSARVMWLATWEGITDPREAVARQERTAESTPGSTHQTATWTAPPPLPESTQGSNGDRPRTHSPARSRDRSPGAPKRRPRSAPVTAEDAEQEFMPELASGAVPSLRQIRARLHVGPERAKALRAHLERVTPAVVGRG
jgi:hypothetical protein